MEEPKLSQDEFVAELARRAGLTVDQTRLFLQAQAEMAFAHVNIGFPVPGIGAAKLVTRPATDIVHKFGPKKGTIVRIPPRKKVVFRFTETAKIVIFGRGAAIPNVFDIDWYPAKETYLE
jgi:hypothetical protein